MSYIEPTGCDLSKTQSSGFVNESLRSLAKRGNFNGYFRAHIAQLPQESFDSKLSYSFAESERPPEENYKILKVEIKRIYLDGNALQVFVVNDISEFTLNQKRKIQHIFSK